MVKLSKATESAGSLGRSIKRRTQLEYTALFTKHVVPLLGETAIGSLITDDVNRWYSNTDGQARAAMLYQHAASGRDAEIAAALSALAERI